MKNISIKFIVAMIVTLQAFNACAEKNGDIVISKEQIYVGAGAGINSITGSGNAIGLQFFGGYVIPANMGDNRLSVEVGYMDTGNFENGIKSAKGLWGTAVFDVPLKNDLSVLGRAGLDIGDDDGVMLGAGFGYQINQKLGLRAEYIIRNKVDSLQVNAVIGL